MLRKMASNSSTVMDAFPTEDHAKGLKDLDLKTDPLHPQRSLVLRWDLQTDSFFFSVSNKENLLTRSGILSTVNSLSDPLGFVSPITIRGKALMREISTAEHDLDTPLSKEKEIQWAAWRDSLTELLQLQIRRTCLFLCSPLSTEKSVSSPTHQF